MGHDGSVSSSIPHDRVRGDLLTLTPVLLAALEQTRSSACITTADLEAPGPTIVYVNPAYCAMTGRTGAEVIGSSPRVMQGPLTDRKVLDRLHRNLVDGEPFSGETVNYRADGTPFLISWSIDPVRTPSGEITHYVATQEDVTDRVRARNLIQATQVLDQVLTDALNATGDRETARQILLDAIVDGAALIVPFGRTTAVLIDDDDMTQITSGSSEADGAPNNGDPNNSDPTVRVDFAQPVSKSRGRILIHGLSANEHAFVDIDGIERYGERVAMVCGSLFEYQRQSDAAIRLQRSLLPPAEIVVPGFDIATAYLPGSVGLEIGGDWYDAAVRHDVVTISVGDVSGSGIEAAALMGRLRLLAAHELQRCTPVPDALTILDRICRDASQMATMLVAQINTSSGAAELWSAGHLPPVFFDANQTSLRYFDVSPPLGFLGNKPIHQESLQLDHGHGLLLFTDGLVERRTEVVTDGLERLRAAVTPGQDLHAMVQAALDATGGQVGDDVAVVALRRQLPAS
jgi:PAS domain S-box-containing protein